MTYRKGPYSASEGDFSSAGAAHIQLFDGLPANTASVTFGANAYRRALLAGTSQLTAGKLTYALEAAHNDGPWDNPEHLKRLNGVLRYSVGDADARSSVTLMGYSSRWNATDQIPQRAVDSGLLSRWGTIDATDGGRTERFSLSWQTQRKLADGEWQANAYAIRSRLNLYSNFTYFLDRPEGDQFEQAERRTVLGGAISRRWNTAIAGREGATTVGVQLRQDRLAPVGLYDTVARERVSTTQESRVRQTSLGVYAQNDTQWTPWLRSVAGLRADRYQFDVTSSIAANSGKEAATIASPKLSLIFGPWSETELFANIGRGFHSNDARGVTARLAPRELTPIDPVNPLVRTTGSEVGLRTEVIPGLQSSVALWQLKLGSELVFVGDAGDTQASRASRRSGIEWNNHFRATPWLLLDADFSVSRARFTQDDPAGNHVPGSVGKVVSLGATVVERGPWFGQFQLRYFGPRPLVEDNSQRSGSTTLAYARVGYKVNERWKVALDVFNLFDRKASDIDYFYASRLRGEAAAGIEDRHFHPVEPRSARLTLTGHF
jgi:outer membrane receptor protein involved in Fe transport